MWVIRVYIVWVNGKKVTLKILQAECFTGTLQDGLSREALTKCNLALDSSTSNICFSHAFFAETSTRKLHRASCKTALIFILCSIVHKLNTKPNTIKSHKIQENNLKHLQHFLSWNKANIKYSCKSQLYILYPKTSF